MKSTVSKSVRLTSPPAAIREQFARLAAEWRTESGTSSNMVKIHLHPSYQRIIGMGPVVLPLIFDDLNRSPDFWFWALRAITGDDPVPAEHAGDLNAMTRDWLSWAREEEVEGLERGAGDF